MHWKYPAITALIMSIGGCLPRTSVLKNPGPHDDGVRYYRPKPYLFVAQAVDRAGEERIGFVTLDTKILPDFAEEYSIHVSPGLGTNRTSIELTDGWNLTGLNIDADSQVDENVRAVSDLVSSAANAAKASASGSTSDSVTVQASNVPLGYYESVVSSGPDGRKRLYGFRYVGFFPYAACPMESCGLSCGGCLESEIYGLVFEDGCMAFRPLGTLPEHHVVRHEAEDESEPEAAEAVTDPHGPAWTEG